ncbi:MAG: peptidylprolyl isomerase [Bacteroidales bacterium]
MRKIIVFSLVMLLIASCALFRPKGPVEKKVQIETNKGDIFVKLYNETPKHRDNFLKLADSTFYDSLLFHRVIDDFMIQAGDPESKNAERDQRLGSGGPGYTIEAEIVDGLYHKRGALAAARESNDVNPEKRSSGSQFYIVEGNKWTDDKLDLLIKRRNSQVYNKYIERYLNKPENQQLQQKVDSLRRHNETEAFNEIYLDLQEKVRPEMMADSVELFDLNEQQRQIYKTVGGSPHLDGEYSVFGEVVLGMDVVEKIAEVDTDIRNRPLKDVYILKMRVLPEKEWREIKKRHDKRAK